jgi:hypothetical protein
MLSSLYRFCIFCFAIVFITLAACSKDGATTAAPDKGTTGAGGSLARFAIVGNFLYIVDNSNLDVYDLSNGSGPVFASTQFIGFRIETIYPYKDKLFIGSATGMFVYSIDDPKKPKQEGSVQHIRACDPVVANDSLAYVTLRSGVVCGGNQDILNVYDIKSSSTPKLLTTVTMKSPYGLGIRDKALYVCEGKNGMTLLDLTDATKPAIKKAFTGDAFYDVIPYQDVLIAYVEKGVSFYDISNPLNPVLLSTVKN